LNITFQERGSSSASLSELAILYSIAQPQPSKIKAMGSPSELQAPIIWVLHILDSSDPQKLHSQMKNAIYFFFFVILAALP